MADTVTFQEYLNIVNDILKEYYLSPISQLNYNMLSSRIYDDFQYRKAAQVRGYLASFSADVVSKDSLNSHPFMMAIEDILKKTNEDYTVLTPSIVFENIENHLTKNKQAEIKNFIETGRNIKLPIEIYNGQGKLVNHQVPTAEYGFNLEKLFNEKVIVDLDKASPAYKAGLREGMAVLYHDIAVSRPSSQITMYVSKNNKTLKFHFLPSLKHRAIPQYVIN